MTPEEERAEQAIATIAQLEPQRRIFVWTMTRGTVEYGQTHRSGGHSTVSPQMAIQQAIREQSDAIFVFKDLHPFLDSPEVVRWLRDAIASFKGDPQEYCAHVPGAAGPGRARKRNCGPRLSAPLDGRA